LLAGLSRQVVNKSLQALEEEGLIRVEHGRIIALDHAALTTYEA